MHRNIETAYNNSTQIYASDLESMLSNEAYKSFVYKSLMRTMVMFFIAQINGLKSLTRKMDMIPLTQSTCYEHIVT